MDVDGMVMEICREDFGGDMVRGTWLGRLDKGLMLLVVWTGRIKKRGRKQTRLQRIVIGQRTMLLQNRSW